MAKKLKLGIDLINAIKELVSGLPTNGVIGYDSNDTIPGGYEETNVDFLDYSTDEIIVGRWIDNKPVYRRAVIFTNFSSSSGNSKSIGLTSSILDTMVRITGTYIASDSSVGTIPRGHPSNASWENNVWLNSSGTLYLEMGSSYTSVIKAVVILEYTKKSD